VIPGGANYFRTAVSKATFSKLADWLFWALRRWAGRRHPNQSVHWVVTRSWQRPRWDFATGNAGLTRHRETRIVRQVQVQGVKAPFDGDGLYWGSRGGHYPEVSPALARLLQEPQGRYASCRRRFFPGEALIERHHKDGDRTNNQRSHLALVHGHCHDAVHRQRPAADHP